MTDHFCPRCGLRCLTPECYFCTEFAAQLAKEEKRVKWLDEHRMVGRRHVNPRDRRQYHRDYAAAHREELREKHRGYYQRRKEVEC